MQIVDDAIILGKNQVKNNNHVVKVFTRNYGLQSVYVSAQKKKKSAKSAVLQPLSLCQIRYTKTKNSSLPILQEAKIDVPLLNIQMDIYKSVIALFTADFLSQVLSENTEEGFYDFIKNSIQIFNEIEEGKSNYHLVLLLKISKWLGIQPSLGDGPNNFFDIKEATFSAVKPNHVNYLSIEETELILEILSIDWNEIQKIRITSTIRRKVLNSIIHYYIFHIPGFKKPKALSILEEVFD
ncbi:MAG: DNA repair protein RecO [Flavobacteriales bacterium]|nr:DNA repair protein RecO [Flavobacteriales bacterium]|tara:strand:+ start:32124 stop:32840 length:717 start_codon:yes stop_codon:yes gene_type:complete